MSINALLQEVQEQTDKQFSVLITRLLERIINPPISIPSKACVKHGLLLTKYKQLACLKTQYNRRVRKGDGSRWNHDPCFYGDDNATHTILDKITAELCNARKTYRGAICECTKGLPTILISPHSICNICGETYRTINACRQPIHLAAKQGKLPEAVNGCLIINDHPLSFDSGSGY